MKEIGKHDTHGGAGPAPNVVEEIAANFPAELLVRHQWVCWKLETRGGKKTKVPYSPVTSRHALTTVASTWGSFERAAAVVDALPETLGLGYVFSVDDPYVGIDFDHCVDAENGQIARWASEWIDRLNSYTEFSPSGGGIHVIARGFLPGRGRKKNGIEIYDRARFFTVTGRPVVGRPASVEEPGTELVSLYDSLRSKKNAALNTRLALRRAIGPELPDEVVIDAILASRSRRRFQELWAGNWKANYGSQSEADLALAGLLAEFIGNNPSQIDRLFRQSGLVREKWDEQRGDFTYGERTIATTLQGEL